MTDVNWGDGLSWEEVLELAYRINIDSVLNPELHARLQNGVNAGLKLASTLQGAIKALPWLTNILKIDVDSDDITNVIDVLTLVKRLLDT